MYRNYRMVHGFFIQNSLLSEFLCNTYPTIAYLVSYWPPEKPEVSDSRIFAQAHRGGANGEKVRRRISSLQITLKFKRRIPSKVSTRLPHASSRTKTAINSGTSRKLFIWKWSLWDRIIPQTVVFQCLEILTSSQVLWRNAPKAQKVSWRLPLYPLSNMSDRKLGSSGIGAQNGK